MIITLYVCLAIGLCMIVAAGAVFFFVAPPRNTTVLSQTSTTETPVGSQLIQAATLGGTYDAFKARFGYPNSSRGGVYTYSFTAPNGKPAYVSIQFSAQGSDNQSRAYKITLASQVTLAEAPHSMTVISSEKEFLPKDAIFLQNKQAPIEGAYRLYRSASLAASFSDSAFTDSAGKLVMPGTFWLSYNSTFDECIIHLGDI